MFFSTMPWITCTDMSPAPQLVQVRAESSWNLSKRVLIEPEYHHKTLTKLAGGNALYGCYGLAITIFSLGILRDAMYVTRSTYVPYLQGADLLH